MKCLVTGGGGFVGSNLALELESQGHEVVVLDNFQTHEYKKQNLEGFKGTVVECDIAVPFEELKQQLQQHLPFEAIFHQAAITDPRHEDDDEVIRVNIEGFDNIIKIAQETSAKLIYASSASMYGNGPSPQKEDQQKDLLSTYARTKLEMDETAAKLFGKMHIVGLRYFNVYGPRESGKGRPASMIYHLYKQMKQDQKPKIFKFGEQKRDQIYVKDVVKANICALQSPSGIYNVGTGRATSFNEIVAALNIALGKDLEPEYIENPYGKTYQENTCADTTKAESELKFKAAYTILEGVKDYVAWLDEHEE